MEVPTELINTIWYTCIYGLMAVPLTLSYRTSNVLNFAHCSYITIGAYTSILITKSLGIKISPILAVLASFIVGAFLAMTTHILVFSPLIKKKSTPVTLMIASMGAWIFIKYSFYAILEHLQKAWKTPLFYTSLDIDIPKTISIISLDLDAKFLLIVTLTAVTFSLLAFFLTKTRTGMAIRAIADNPDLAQVSGISKEKTLLLMWAISGGLAAVGGFAWSLFAYVSPETGDSLILQVFACSVIGGVASLPLTFVGSLIISSTENLLIIFLHNYLGIELSFRPFFSFFILVITILIKPPAGAGGGLPYRYQFKAAFKRFLGGEKSV